MVARPITFREASRFVAEHHRHHQPPRGGKFCIGAFDGEEILGVIIAGRPIARMLDDGLTCEVTRLCTTGRPNVCSFLYSRVRKVAFAMGYRRVITYTLASEAGTSLRASGWRFEKVTGGGSWSRPSRERIDKAPTEAKQLWVTEAA